MTPREIERVREITPTAALVAKLRNWTAGRRGVAEMWAPTVAEAADRLEALEAELRDVLSMIEQVQDPDRPGSGGMLYFGAKDIRSIREALGE